MRLKNQVVSGFFWTASEKVSSLVIVLVYNIVLISLLEPYQFGLFSMLAVFSVVGNSLVDSGFSQALIQKKEVTPTDYDSIFWLNVIIAIVLYIILVALTGQIARFYESQELIKYAPWVFLTIPINALGLIQTTICSKTMDFKSLSKSNFTASLSSGIVVIIMAFAGFGVWALVCQILTLNFVRTSMLWIYGSWRPGKVFSFRSIKSLFGLGSKFFATGLMTQFFNSLSLIIIGKFYNASSLGLYERSLKLKDNVSGTISLSVLNVTFPAFASLQDDGHKLKISFRKVIGILSFVLFPVMAGLMATAEEGFMIVGQEKWMPAVPYFRILCLSAFCIPLSHICLNIVKAKGEGTLLLKTEILKKGFGIAAISLGAMIDVMAIAWGYLLWVVFEMVVNVYNVYRLTGYSLREQIKDTLPYLIISAGMFVAVYSLGFLGKNISVYSLLGLKVAAGIFVYLTLSWLFRPEAWQEIKIVYQNIITRLKKN